MTAINQILIILAVVHAYVFAIMFFAKQRKSATILGFFMAFTFIEYFLNVNMFYFKFAFFRPAFYYLVPFFTLIPMPLIYLYVRYIASEKYIISLKSLLHFLPAIAAQLFAVIILLNIPAETRSQIFNQLLKNGIHYENIKLFFVITTIVFFIQVFLYLGLNLFQLFRHKKTLKETYSYKEKISLNWLLLIIYFLLVHYFFEFIVFIYPDILSSETLYYGTKLLIVLFIGVMGLRQKEIYLNKDVFVDKQAINEQNHDENERKKCLPISEEQKAKAIEDIMQLMETDKIYLKHDLSLYDIAQKLDLNKNYVSFIINDVFEVNFFTFINNYRIKEAQKMLTDSRYDNLSIEGIANSAGFKSRNVFYPVFKKLVGMTPLQYKNEERKKQNTGNL